MLFENRTHAGKLTAELLRDKIEDRENTILLAIPRGGVEIAYNMAKVLNIPFSLIIVRKLGIPWNEEAAFGSIDPDGISYIDEAVVRYAKISKEEIERVKAKELTKIKERINKFLGGKEPEVRDKRVIIVDDGIATGYTVIAGISYVKRKGAKEVMVASPVCPEDAVLKIGKLCDRVFCFYKAKEGSFAVGMFYKDFKQLDDEEVLKIIERAKREGLFYQNRS